MLEQPWLAFWSSTALAIVIYGINMLGDAMRDLIDPRLRGNAGRLGLPKKRKKKGIDLKKMVPSLLRTLLLPYIEIIIEEQPEKSSGISQLMR